ncbi:MAG: DEAD/DEAH box helicase [Halanaerobiales bacterium]|nr:DEAD/DEAH box helicase [Halanaerobiales bacterium]
MKVKKYVGDNIQDIIFRVKVDLGTEAIILDTRKFKEGGFLGFFAKEKVEVLAGLEDNNPQEDKTKKEIDNLKDMIQDLNNNVNQNVTNSNIPKVLKNFQRHLKKHNVKDEYIVEILNDINTDEKLDKSNLKVKVKNYLIDMIGKPELIETTNKPKTITFIGPTGIGKTTTIAKIAAEFAIKKEKKVCLITADTYRIAAVQQLRTYSDIINIPLKVVYDGSEFIKAVEEFKKEADLILVDTPGRNWKNKWELGQLNEFAKQNIVDEIHLMLSLNMDSKDLNYAVKNFNNLNPDKFILTKLDETSSYGDIINLKQEYDIPFSYITFGQDVPEDIDKADPEILYNYLMGDFDE